MGIVAFDRKSVRGTAATVGPAGPAGPFPTEASCANQGPVRRPGPTTWHDDLKHAIRDPYELVTALELPAEFLEPARMAAQTFPLFAPRPYVARMRKGDPYDPLLRQILPLADELDAPPGFTSDAVGDSAAMVSPGLLQKYHSRALLITTGACAIHCRYCFRREYPYSESPKSAADWQSALDRIGADSSIDEIILSGGDPLTLTDNHLAELASRIAQIPHVQRLRVHTRLPIVIPSRVTTELIDWLRGTRLTPIVVIHANHANELDDATSVALARLIDAGIPLLNQTVLLRGINDNAEALINLSRRLVNLRVTPYYLHQLDRVRGAAHFEVPISHGLEIIAAMRKALPGYAVPRYVQEIAGEASKRVLA